MFNFSARRVRTLREYLTAYFMIAPALILIFTFGIFPVLFAVYVSMHRWKIKQGDFLGLTNYIRAIDSLAYLLFFAVALGFLYAGFRTARQIWLNSRAYNESPWALILPGILHGVAWLLLLRWAALLLPEVLGIADKVRNIERTQEIFLQFFGEALRAETVAPAFNQFLWTILAATVISVVLYQILPVRQRFIAYLSNFASSTFFLISAGVTIWFTITQIQFAITTALETGEEVKIGVQITLIAAGLLLFYLAWKVWNSAVHHESNRGFVLKLLAALFLLVGGWILLAELPMAIQAGDEDLWQGLVVTVYYAMGTIPFQLSFAIMLAYLLFQKVRAREFFRVVYFLPYVTPAVAGAAVFQLLFSNRSSSPANLLLRVTGGEAARWLQESRGVFVLIGQSMGVEVPGWMGGPSLALVVIIIYSIWTYVGYDTVIYLAGMGNIPLELNEAAEIDGANRWQIFRYVTFPLLSPTTYFLSLIAVIGTFKAFNHIFVMRDPLALGTVDTFSVAIFDEFFNRTRFGYASAMAFVLFAVILALTYVNNKVQGSRVFYE